MRVLWLWATALVLAVVEPALAQEAAANPADTFPATLGYAAIGAVTTAGAAMSAVIGKLWAGLRDQAVAHQAALDSIKASYVAEVKEIRDRLEKEQRERREEAEKLLREQKDIMREVMVTCASIQAAFTENTKAFERLAAHWEEEE